MAEPLAYLNGQFVPASQAVVSVYDGGFVQGVTVAEQLRTFAGRLFQLEAHVERLYRSLAFVDVEPGLQPETLMSVAEELVVQNYQLLPGDEDLGLTIFVTPGPYAAMVRGKPAAPTLCMHTFPLRFELWADKYMQGESLSLSENRQVPAECWPPELKCRSRMHYYLADRAARARFPGSRALMLDAEGHVTEATTANLVLFRQDTGLIMPPAEKVLPGISLAVLVQLAIESGLSTHECDLSPQDVANCEEAFLTSTSPCMLPVTRFGGQPIGAGVPGPVFHQLLRAWSELVGLDIADQAQKVARRYC